MSSMSNDARQASLAHDSTRPRHTSRHRHIRRVAVCGAGVMGAQIAAHCVNAGVPVVLFDLPGKDSGNGPVASSRHSIVERAIGQLRKLRPAPLALPQLADRIVAADYDSDLHLLGECDLVIEAIAERLDWKLDLYRRIAPALGAETVLATNTSGLSIAALSQGLPTELQGRFCGVHFFNPPRYMHLVELVAGPATAPELLDTLETFLTTGLGKGVVRARDTPNFIANRVGVFGLLSIFHHTQEFDLPFELVDELTGVRLGRAKSGTFRTADVVGLDTLAHVTDTMREHLPEDSFHALYRVPAVVAGLIEQGALGQKTGAGLYRKEGRTILRLDPHTGEYVPANQKAAEEIVAVLRMPDPAGRLQALHDSEHPQARFLWSVLRDSFHYSAVHLAEIADSARAVDEAMKWGFGHQHGPFEIWQAAGWRTIAGWIREDIDAGRTLSSQPLPDWVTSGPVWDHQAVHTTAGSFSAQTGAYEPRRHLPVYQRQLCAPRLLGESPARAAADARRSTARQRLQAICSFGGQDPVVVHETEAVLCWTLPAAPASGNALEAQPAVRRLDDILILSFKTKMNTISPAVVEGVMQAIELAERDFAALVIAQLDEPFSAGADLQAMASAFGSLAGVASGPDASATADPAARAAAFEKAIRLVGGIQKAMQDMQLRIRYAQVPVVAAIAGMALGGGCELALYCARRVAHLESYIGLVELGVGLVPGAGGLAYGARRAASLQATVSPQMPLLACLRGFAETVANARVSTSAAEARELGFLQAADPIVMHRHELLHVALHEAASLAEQGWRAPLPSTFPVAGRDGIATIKAQLVNLRVGEYISDYDFHLAEQLAKVLCGGDVDPGSLVDDAWMLQLEREVFQGLLARPKTQERILGMLKTGKPVRN